MSERRGIYTALKSGMQLFWCKAAILVKDAANGNK